MEGGGRRDKEKEMKKEKGRRKNNQEDTPEPGRNKKPSSLEPGSRILEAGFKSQLAPFWLCHLGHVTSLSQLPFSWWGARGSSISFELSFPGPRAKPGALSRWKLFGQRTRLLEAPPVPGAPSGLDQRLGCG